MPHAWWTRTFRRSVKQIGRTVLVLQPWHEPLPLKRSWCLWEIFCTLDGGAELEVVLTPAQRRAFQAGLVRCAHDCSLLRLIAWCMIPGVTHDIIRADVGFHAYRACYESDRHRHRGRVPRVRP
jgi:hypothetical protein